MAIRRLVHRNPVTITAAETAMDAIKKMADEKIGAIAVVEGKKIIGIFTERDVMKKIVLQGLDASKTKLEKVMTHDVRTARGSISIRAAMEIMSKHQFRHLPIVNDKDELEGMVSLRYIMFDIMDDLEKQASALESYMSSDGPGG